MSHGLKIIIRILRRQKRIIRIPFVRTPNIPRSRNRSRMISLRTTFPNQQVIIPIFLVNMRPLRIPISSAIPDSEWFGGCAGGGVDLANVDTGCDGHVRLSVVVPENVRVDVVSWVLDMYRITPR